MESIETPKLKSPTNPPPNNDKTYHCHHSMHTSLGVSFDLPLPLAQSFSLVASIASSSQRGKPINSITLPWIREAKFGHTLGIRSNVLSSLSNGSTRPGPADLVHWGRHYGERSSTFTHNEFAPPTTVSHSKEEDGYVGYFHFCNGIDYTSGPAMVEEYLLKAIGLESRPDGYFWSSNTNVASYGVYNNKQMVLTLCAYNIFGRQELRARLIILVAKSRKLPVTVDCLYNVTSQLLKKLHNYNRYTVTELPESFWLELAVSSIVRLFYSGDDPSHQLCGTVSLPVQLQSKEVITNAVDRIIDLLPKGHLTGHRASMGAPTASGDGSKVFRYKNRLVDALKRLVLLDLSGKIGDHAISRIETAYGKEFDYVICQLYRAQHNKNNDQQFLSLVHTHLGQDSTLTQAALLMVEQVRFLVAKGHYSVALTIAARAVGILPLDFDAWYHLALCYIMERKFDQALQTINCLPVVFTKLRLAEDSVDDVYDTYAMCFMERMVYGQGISMDSFEKFFPPPKSEFLMCDEGSIQILWYLEFVRRPHLRHPISGPFFQSPLSSATPIEISAVDAHIMKVSSPSSKRHILSSQSRGNPWTSVLDFDRTSTWGRAYDLITTIVAIIGWDSTVQAKANVFRKGDDEDSKNYVVDHLTCSREECQPWLDLLFLVVYEDIRAMMVVSSEDNNRSALSWNMIGLVGWSCKYNLKDSISSIVTSVAGVAADGGFDYFGTVKLLEIYNEFVLSDVESSSIDRLTCVYDGRSYSNKLIVQSISPTVLEEFEKQLVDGYLTLELVLLYLMKLVSWNLRWYQYIPSHLATNTLVKLCIKYDLVYIRLILRVVYETYKQQPSKKTSQGFSVLRLFATKGTKNAPAADFAEADTVVEYMERLLSWIESIHS